MTMRGCTAQNTSTTGVARCQLHQDIDSGERCPKQATRTRPPPRPPQRRSPHGFPTETPPGAPTRT
eukprot:CAMPEP_0180535850 /NCGR_PEP_ID=MMETSP1036_2-20121128/64958_1 /TAXON_ID=632150 /ORGANISM="Azadinium spinosum, Strain 3D9" /LENGTH=65 /DNA_ID=CAMNT_0022550317 /DNA_START=222 /DNA_END=419 /DNA_ORIENTATION=-